MIIKIIVRTEKLGEFYSLTENDLNTIPKGCLVTVEQVEIKLQKRGDTR